MAFPEVDHPVFTGADPQDALGVEKQVFDRLRADDFEKATVETGQAGGRAHPENSVFVLRQGADVVGGQSFRQFPTAVEQAVQGLVRRQCRYPGHGPAKGGDDQNCLDEEAGMAEHRIPV